MRDDKTAVDWYRGCIHERQRRASRLTIEVGLKAQDSGDPEVLAEAMECFDAAIEVLEQAKAIDKPSDARDALIEAERLTRPQRLMDDLGHSMAPMEFPELYRSAASPNSGAAKQGRGAWNSADLPIVVRDDSLRFFE